MIIFVRANWTIFYHFAYTSSLLYRLHERSLVVFDHRRNVKPRVTERARLPRLDQAG